ncbi:zinc finger protein 260-like [Corythoichthys intestinalis]|uniref:zinc finger protein 260-like n=1 Tax=Corythoichthys intestinalis TaxID=161448 RepID=UPI0025A57BDB|nr:zinc finger protein 260-like [Corythoichthys intestinalis]
MGKKCWVLGCKTGYDSNKAFQLERAANGTPITIHKFPRDDELRARWLKNINRDEEDDPSAERYCCSLHFKDSDFKSTPTVHEGAQRRRKRLVEDAVPTVFNRCVAYPPCMQEAPHPPMLSTSMSSSTARSSAHVAEAASFEHEFMDSDLFTSLEDLKEKIKAEIPRNYRISLDKHASEQNWQFLTLLTYEPVLGALPAMATMLRIGENGSFLMTKGGVKIANSKLRHILHGHWDVFTRVSQVTIALAFLNNYSVEETDKCPADITVEDFHPEKHDPLHIKQEEESEMPYIKQEAELETASIKAEEQEDEITKFPMSVRVKSEENEGPSEESGAAKPLCDSSFQHLSTKEERLSQPDGLLGPLSDSDDVTSHSSDFNTDEEDTDFDQNASKFLNESSFKRDTKECAGGKPLSCSHCDKRFRCKHNLKRHMRTHTSEKTFACSLCDKTFSERIQLGRHTQTHAGEKPFLCSICGKTFTQKRNLDIHAKLHTAEKSLACPFCDKRFHLKDKLTRHIRIHTGERPFVCTCCGKGFTERGNLNKHTKSHTREKPFVCTNCGKRFTRKIELEKHMLGYP